MTEQPERPEPPRERSLLDDPGVRRGLRIGGRLIVGWAIFVAVITVIVLVIIIVVFVKIFSGDTNPSDPSYGSLGVVRGLLDYR